MNRALVTCILASAGSGKTFQLTSRYLDLVRRGVDPARILATTFSRAAAAEIRDRVLRRAADAVLDEGKRSELEAALGVELDAAESVQLLERVVRGLPRMQVRTLDSFFAGVVSAFATELGQASAPRVLDDGEERTLLLDAIRLAMEEEDQEALLQTILSLVRGKRVAAVVRTAENEVKDLLEVAAESEEAAWIWDEPASRDDGATLRLLDELRVAAREAGAGRLSKVIFDHVSKVETALETGGEAWYLDNFGSIVKAALEGGEITFYNKPLPDDLADTYRELARVLVQETGRGYVRMTAAMRALATAVQRRRTRITRERAVATFADLTALLDPRRNEQPELAEVWFRIDGRIQHLLLDEFQDTSVVQWRALQRLAEEIVAGGEEERSLFVVGDVKQAIYGWRGGEPRLLSELPTVLREEGAPVEIEERELVTSYRSSRSVIEFVNRVFGGLDAYQGENEVETNAVAHWARRFTTHSTKNEDVEGFVEVVAVPFGDTAHRDKNAPLECACKRVVAARQRLPRASIGVIVRSNAAVAGLARRLQRAGHAVRVIGRGSLLDREAPLCVLQALRLAEWPGDSLAAFDLAHSPLARCVGLAGVSAGEMPSIDAAVSASRELRRRFERDGIAVTIDSWRRELAPELDDHEQLRLEQMVAVIDRLAATADRSPGEVAALVMKARVENAAGGEIAVMTVHQSKGLEFDVVVVTDIEGKLEGHTSRRRLAWKSPLRPTAPIPRVVRWPTQSLREVLPEMGEVCDHTLARQIEESLSTLYVALTRARDELVVVVSSHKTTKNGAASSGSVGTLAAIVRRATDEPEVQLQPDEPGRTILSIGAPTTSDLRPLRDSVAPRVEATVGIRPAPRPTRRAKPASAHGGRPSMFRLRDRDALDRGTAFHAALATIAFLDDAGSDPGAMATAVRDALPARGEDWIGERVDEVRDALVLPNLRALLGRPNPRVEACTEHRFVRLTPAGVVEGSIDRLTLERDEQGAVCSATVVDFKTDTIPADRVGELAARYGEQLREYGEVVGEQFGLASSAVRLGLFALEHDRFIDVPDARSDDPTP